MATYLLTWNPTKYNSWYELPYILKYRRSRWSCGSRKTLPKDSRVFLYRQGSTPRGIVASGYTTRKAFQDEHWDPARRRNGIPANYVQVAYDAILGPDRHAILQIERLRSGKLKRVNWRTQSSGIEVPEDAAVELERLWRRVSRKELTTATKRELIARENTLVEVKYYVRKRDQKIRDQAIAAAAGICECCDENYGVLLDGLGHRVLQVHHRRQLAASDKPRLTRVRDLTVVCANCHAMIHVNPKRAMRVEALRRKLRSVRA